jgi:hypothetical protein
MNDIKLTRKELFDLVWSEPMLTLAKRYDVSDVGLRKICKKLNVLLPKMGHWAKIKFGKVSYVPKYKDDFSVKQEVIIYPGKGEKFRKDDREAEIQKEIESDPHINLKIPKRLTRPDKLIESAYKTLHEQKPYQRDGGLVSSRFNGLDISVSPENISRALRFCDTLIKAIRAIGGDIRIGWKATYANIGGEDLKIKIREKLTSEKVIEPPFSWASTIYHKTGILSFRIDESQGKEWKDGKLMIEDQILQIFTKLILLGRKAKERRIEWEKERAKEAEREQIRKEWEQRQEKELLDFKGLLKKAERFRQTQMLRIYIDAFKEYSVNNGAMNEEIENWVSWAQKKADWYDPFIESPDELLKNVNRETLSNKKKQTCWDNYFP